ncbi:MAG: penicillin-binding transpeptidase domain-containing protein [Ilumatobacteraceae bacterium]
MNKQIRRLAAGLLVCFLILFVQLNRLQVVQRDSIASNTNNNRAVLRDFDKPRGAIVTADGVEIANSVASTDDKFKYQRVYPTKDLFANVSGYYTYAFGATKLEKKYTEVLTGRTSEQQIRSLANILSNEDNTGSVQLTMRADLQQVAKDALGEREGSVVVLDPRTGAVLAMYSYPSYDPNVVAVHNNTDAQNALEFLNNYPGKPTLANAYQERYMPGSTFKVVTTGIALEAGLIDFDSFWANESEYLPPDTTNPIANYKGHVCGGDLREVFRRSCNTPFARIAVELGPQAMVAGTQAWGIGEKIPFDIPGAVASNFGTVEELQNNIPRLAIRGFGQDDDLMVPLQMAMITSTVANGGVMMQPYAVEATLDHNGGILDQTKPSPWKTPLSQANALKLTELMIGVVQNGTAKCCLQLANGVQAAAKTGTAQLNATGEPQRSHAWITAFAPAEAPRFAVAVILKGTTADISEGTGGVLAGPIAKTVLDFAMTLPTS